MPQAKQSFKEEIAAIERDTRRIRESRESMVRELALLDMPHTSDCDIWVGEPCRCIVGDSREVTLREMRFIEAEVK